MVRFTVSVDDEIGAFIDSLVKEYGYASRSELIRDLAREKKAELEVGDSEDAIGVLIIAYNHDNDLVVERLNKIGHEKTCLTLFSTHIHATEKECVEIIVLRGKAKEIRDFAIKLGGIRDIHLSKFMIIPLK
jgi:CopG family nickel-responsive transcriptional regulator